MYKINTTMHVIASSNSFWVVANILHEILPGMLYKLHEYTKLISHESKPESNQFDYQNNYYFIEIV